MGNCFFKRLTCRMELVQPQFSHGSGIATCLTCPRCHFMPNVDFNFLAGSFYKIGIVPAKMFLRIILSPFEVDGNRQRRTRTHDAQPPFRRNVPSHGVPACQLAKRKKREERKFRRKEGVESHRHFWRETVANGRNDVSLLSHHGWG